MERLKPSKNAVFQELEGEGVLVHLRTNRIYSLSATGARFWRLLQDEHDPDAIMGQMLAEYDVEDAVLRREVADLTATLAREGLIEPAP